MIFSRTTLEVKKDEKTYLMIMPSDSLLGEVFDVLSQMRHLVAQKIDETVKIQEQQNKETDGG